MENKKKTFHANRNQNLTGVVIVRSDKTEKQTSALNFTIEQIDLIYKTVHSTAGEYTFCTSAHGTFSRIDMLGHQTSLNIFKSKSYQVSHWSQWNKITRGTFEIIQIHGN